MQNGLNTRQWVLKKYLENNFVSGKYFSIEEIVANVMYGGEPLYKLNTNPRIHDKCVMLSSDVREINWNMVDGYKIIVKDKKGGIKLAENIEEFNQWYEEEMKPLITKIEYLNILKGKAKLDGTCPIINKANNPVEPQDVKPVKVFEKIDIFDISDLD